MKMMKPLWNLSNWNSSNKVWIWGFRGRDLLNMGLKMVNIVKIKWDNKEIGSLNKISRGRETLYKLKLIEKKILKYLRECLRWITSKIFCFISLLKKGVYWLIGFLNGRVSNIVYWTVRYLKGMFRDRLYWVMFIVGFITVYWWCGLNVEIISKFVYKTVIYKLYIGYIIGVIVSKIIAREFSKFNWSKGENNKNVKNTSIIITVIVILFLSIVSNVGIGLLPRVYCDDVDDIVVSDSKKSNIENDDDSYHFKVSKHFVKEGFDTVLKTLSDSLPELVAGLGGAKIGSTVVKVASNLPPVRRAALGVITGGASALCIGIGGVLVKNFRKASATEGGVDGDDLIVKIPRASLEKLLKGETDKKEFVQTTARKLVEYESKENCGGANEASTSASGYNGGSSASGNNGGIDSGDGGNFIIPSLLDDSLSPLEIIINCGVLTNIMILVHIILIVLILIQKFNVKIIKESSVGFIRKYLNKYKLNKLENFINKVGEFNNKYLSRLIVINVIIIIIYVLLNVYVNIELNSNLNGYIYDHVKFHIKEECILLLLLNSDIKYKNNIRSRFKKRLFSNTNIRNKKGDIMNVDYTELMEMNLNTNENENESIKIEMKINKNREMKEKIKDNISKQELRKMKGIIEEKDIKRVKESREPHKGIVEKIDNQKFLLESKFDIESLPKISEGIVNKNIIQNVPEIFKNLVPGGFNFKELDQKFSNFIKFLYISKKYITKKNFKFLVQGLFDILTDLGVESEIQNKFKSFLNSEVEIFTDFYVEKYDYLALELLEYCEKRHCTFDLNTWEKLVYMLKCINKFNISELEFLGDKLLNNLKNKYKTYGTVDQFSGSPGLKVKRVPKAKKPWKNKSYQNTFDVYLKEVLNELNKELISWIGERNNILFSDVSNWKVVFDEVILDMNKYLGLMLFGIDSSDLILSSNPKIISYINRINKVNISEFYEKNRSRNVGLLYELLFKTGSMRILENKINKFSLKESPLLQMLDDLLSVPDISLRDKQITIERALVEYELKFFNTYFNNCSNQIKIINQEYENILNNYNVFLKGFTINKYNKLKDLFSKNKDKGYGIIVLMILYMGRDRTISLVFKEILNILFNPSSNLDLGAGINKTNLIYMLAKKFIKHISLIESTSVDKAVNNICSFNELKALIKNMSEIDLIHLGDTLFSLIQNGSELFVLNLIKSKKNAEVLVEFNPSYYNSFIISSITISQLPMIVQPRAIGPNGIYFPYINTDNNVLNLSENKIIKGKYDQRYKTEGSDLFYNSINYLNSIKFKINIPMLVFVIEEWNKDNSILFKGYNKSTEILKSDNTKIRKDKEKHNALHQLYLNIINIAILFRAHVFFLPVFSDFRGRLYTLSNYLTYQGNDLARSLLLFDSNEELNDNGYECLNVYFSNLAGYDKKSWNDRINISDKITNDFKEYTLTKNEDKLKELITDLSEPFQFISIGLAKIEYLEKEKLGLKTIINNPILFDASCSGIQHISALTLDQNLARYTNVISYDESPKTQLPEDFYTFALNIIKEKLAISNNELLRNISLNRQIIKRSVMTIPYNISMTGIGEQIEEHFSKTWELKQYVYIVPENATVNGQKCYIYSKDFGELIKIIYEVLTKDIPSLKNLTNYFKEIITILNKLNLPVTWTTPAGVKIRYQQIKFDSVVTKNKIISISKPITISIPTNKTDKSKMIRSFMPNFIHSLDASNVHILLYKLLKNDHIPVYTVHDCFASTANNMSILEHKVKNAFIDIYFDEEGFLLKSHNRIISQIKEVHETFTIDGKEYIDMSSYNIPDILIPELPEAFKTKELKEFIKGLLNSKYFIG